MDSKVLVRMELRGLKPVLREWTQEQARFRAIVDDFAWWYGERSNIGLLAVAACRLRGVAALEEFSTRKCLPEINEDKKDRHGRCDLWISGSEWGKSYAIEAKQAWTSIGASADFGSNIDSAFEKGPWADAGNLVIDEADVRVALLFVVPRIPCGQFDSAREQLVTFTNWLAAQRTPHRFHAVAWTLESQMKECLSADKRHSYPGVAIVAKVRQRAIKRRPAKAR